MKGAWSSKQHKNCFHELKKKATYLWVWAGALHVMERSKTTGMFDQSQRYTDTRGRHPISYLRDQPRWLYM
jgi:hypothetical protein